MLPLLAGVARLLRRQLVNRGRFRQKEVRAGARGLLRVSASQERGSMRNRRPDLSATLLGLVANTRSTRR